MNANFVMETKEVEADFYLDNTINLVSGTSDHSELTNRDLVNQHPIKSITGLQDILDGLENNESQLGNKVSTIQGDVNALKEELNEKGFISSKTQETQELSGAFQVKNQIDILGNNGHSLQLSVTDTGSQITSSNNLSLYGNVRVNNPIITSDSTSYINASSNSIVRKQQVEQAISNFITEEQVDKKIEDALDNIETGGTVDLSAYLSKEEASATYSTKDNVSSSIVEHNSSTQSHSDIRDAIKANTDSLALKANKSDVYTKEQVDAKISSVYRFCGSVASYNNLPQSDQVIGDTYNVEDTGANYAWTGTLWDKLSETIDLTNYATTENVNSSIAEHNLSSQSHNDIRNSLAGKANLASQENTKIGNIAVVDKDGQYEVSDTKLSDLNADIGTLNTQVSENTTKLASCVTSSTVTNITQITQAEYDALTNKDSTTLYIIIG